MKKLTPCPRLSSLFTFSPAALSRASLLALAVAAALLWPGGLRPAAAAGITFSPPVTVSADTDAYPYGGLRYAYNQANAAATINGVAFAAGTSTTTLGGGNVTMSGYTGGANTTAFGSGAGAPWSTLSAAYQIILRGGAYTAAATPAVNNLNNLTAGRQYAVQFWVNENRGTCCFNRTETVSGGNNTVTLAYNSTKAAGGVGQYTVGYFTASGASQSFTNLGTESTQMNAIHLRDVTGSWNGAENGNWDSSAVNFSGLNYTALTGLGVTNVFFADKDAAGNAPITTNVTVAAGGVTGANANFQNYSLNYTLTSTDGIGLFGAYTLSKVGGGLVTINGAHNYTGLTTISGGALRLNDANALPNSTVNLGVNNGLAFGPSAGGTVIVGGLSGAVNLALRDTASGPVNLSVGNNNSSTTFSGILSGPGGLTKAGSGTLTLSAANTYSGGTIVNGGTLALTTAHQGGGEFTINDYANLRLSQLAPTATVPMSSLTLGGTDYFGLQFGFFAGPTTAPITATNLVVNGVVNVSILSGNFTPGRYPLIKLINGDISAAAPFVLAGIPSSLTAALVYNTVNNSLDLEVTAYDILTWTGSTSGNWDLTTANWQHGGIPGFYFEVVPPGEAVLFNDTLVGNSTVTVIGTLSPSAVTVSNVNTNYTFTGTGSIAGQASLTKDGAGSLTLSNPNTHSGGTIIRAGSVNTGVAGGFGTAAVAISNGAALNLTVGNTTYTGPNAGLRGGGTVNVTVGTGSQTVPLNGVNSNFAGILNVGIGAAAGAGKLQLNGVLGSAATVNVLPHATVFLSATVTQPSPIILNGGDHGESLGQLRVENGTWSGPVTLAGDVTGTGDGSVGANSGTGTISGSIGESGGSRALLKAGGGTTVLSGANTFTGPTGVRGGALRLAHTLALQFSTLTNAVTFDPSVASRTFTLGGLSGTNNLALQDTAAGPINLSVGNNNASTTYGGNLSGVGSLTKIGSGTLTLTGTNAHTGATYANAGILQLGASGVINNASTIQVGPSGILDVSRVTGGFLVRPNQTLAGFGVVTGNVAVAQGAILAPGAVGAAGTLSLSSPLAMTNGMLKFDFSNTTAVGGGVNDLLVLNGPLSLSGANLVQPNLLAGNLAEGTYTLITGITRLASGDASNLQLSGLTRQSIAFSFVDQAAPSVSGVTNLVMTVGGASANLAWAGTNDLWDLGTTFNWANLGTSLPDRFFNLDGVLFNDTLATNSSVSLLGTLLPASTTVSNVNTSYTFSGSGSLAGSTSLTKDGAGLLTLSNANTHFGGTAVRAGTLIVATTTALGAGVASVNPGATLQLNSPATTTFTPPLAGAGLLKLNISGGVNNTYLNNLTAFTGTIQIANTGATGNKWNLNNLGLINADLVIDNGSQLFVPGSTNSFRSISVSGPGNTENRGAIRFVGIVGGPITLLGDTTFGPEGGTITGDIRSGAAGLQTLTLGTANSASALTLWGNIGGGIGTIGLNKTTANTLTLPGTNTYSGPTTIGAGTVLLTASGSISNTAAISLAAGTTLNALAPGGISLGANQTLSGSGSVLGNVIAGAGSQIVPGGSAVGTLTLSSNLSLSSVSALEYQLGATNSEGAGVNDLLQVNGDLALSGVSTVRVAFAGAPALGQPYTLINYTGALSGRPTNLTVFNDTRFSFALDFTVTNKVRLVITGSPGLLTWVGGNPDNNWNLATTPNWDGGAGEDFFYSGDSVTFNDGTPNTSVNLVGTLRPADLNVVADQNYVFEGSGSISGGRLNKSGTGTLTIANPALNTFAGGTFVTGGTLQIGNGGTTGVLPGGPVTVDSTLAFNRSDDMTVSNAVIGAGVVRKRATNTLNLASPNSHGGGTLIEAGTLRLLNNAALGNVATAITTVSNGATLDLSSMELWNYLQPIVLNGPGVAPSVGALGKSAAGNQSGMALRSLTLGSDASIGGVTNARIDIGRGDWPGAVPVGPIHLDGQGHTLSLVGGVYLGILAGAQSLAGVIINNGTSIAPHNDNSLGEATVTLNGGTLSPWGANHIFMNSLVLNSGFINNQAFMNTYTGPVQLNGPVEINTMAGGDIIFTGNLAGPGGIAKIGANTLVLSGTNTYEGGTVVSNGALRVDGVLGSSTSLVSVAGATLLGNGVIRDAVSVATNGILTPGLSVGVLTISNRLTLAGTNVMEIDKANRTNDLVRGLSHVAYGGTLVVNNLGGTLTYGDTFKLFDAAHYGGGFASLQLPALPAELRWNTAGLMNNGTISVTATNDQPQTIASYSFNAGAGTFTLTFAGIPGYTYRVQYATTLTPPADWTDVSTNTVPPSGFFPITDSVAGSTNRFYRTIYP